MLRNTGPAAMAAAIILGSAASDGAQAEVTRWKTINGWDISFYSEQRGCLARTSYTEGTTFFIGFDTTGTGLLLDVTLIDNRWESIVDGTSYDIIVKFGNESPWTLNMIGRRYGESPGLAILIDAGATEARRFVDEFQRKSDMRWTYKGALLGHFTLRGSRRALDEAIACQKSYNSAVSSVADPFAGVKSDPFSQ